MNIPDVGLNSTDEIFFKFVGLHMRLVILCCVPSTESENGQASSFHDLD